MKRWMIIGLAIAGVVILVAGVISIRARRTTSIGEGFQTVAAARGPLTATVGATGTVRANQQAVLAFETSGTVDRVFVHSGELVAEGERLAGLRSSSLPSQVILAQADLVAARRALDDLLHSNRALADAELALANARDALRAAEYKWTVQQQGNRASDDTVKAARARLVVAQATADHLKHVYDKTPGKASEDAGKAEALSAYLGALANRDAAQRNLNWYVGHPTEIQQAMLDGEVAVARAEVADAQREYDRLKDGPDGQDVAAAEARVEAAQATLDSAWITAPFAGTITSVNVKPGDVVTPGSVAFELADLQRLLVDVDVSEVDINRILVGQPVSLTFDAILDRTYGGHVTEVGLIGEPVQGVVNFTVTVELDDADEQVRGGLTAAVSLVVEQIQNALLVPNRAVRVRDGERVVYILQDGIPTPVPVRLGVSSDTDSEVVDGELQVGDLILLNPPTEFSPPGPGGGGGFVIRR